MTLPTPPPSPPRDLIIPPPLDTTDTPALHFKTMVSQSSTPILTPDSVAIDPSVDPVLPSSFEADAIVFFESLGTPDLDVLDSAVRLPP